MYNTREKAKTLLPIIEAFANGKSIQYRNNSSENWIDVNDEKPATPTEYRIKPQPKLIPFTFEDNELFKDKWIRFKTARTFLYRIISIGGLIVRIADKQDKVVEYKYSELLDLFEFEDGTPFGKYIKE